MKNLPLLSKLFGVLLFFGFSSIQAAEYSLDGAHSKMGFSVDYMMFSEVDGRFKDFDLKLNWDAKSPEKSSVKFTIKAASIFTDNEKRDGHLKSPDFLDVEKYPEITFVSKSFSKKGKEVVVSGDFTLHGVTKEISFPVKVNNLGNDPWGNTKVAFTAKPTLNRMDYGVKWNKALEAGGILVGEEVRANFVIIAIEKK